MNCRWKIVKYIKEIYGENLDEDKLWVEIADRASCFNQKSGDWTLNETTKPTAYHDWATKKDVDALILSLFLRVKILHLAHHKFTFLIFRSNYSCLFSHFNDVALAITKFGYRHLVDIVLWTAWAKFSPSTSMLRKGAVGRSLKKVVASNVLFSSI